MSDIPRNRILTGLCLSIILTDQLAKFFILKFFTPAQSIPLIKSVFHITLVLNKGGAFGMLAPHPNATPMFVFISIIVILAILGFLFRKGVAYNIEIALGSIMAGAISNLIDRLRFGYVVDFLDFRIWPVFNIADTAITLGTLWLVWKIIKGHKHASYSV